MKNLATKCVQGYNETEKLKALGRPGIDPKLAAKKKKSTVAPSEASRWEEPRIVFPAIMTGSKPKPLIQALGALLDPHGCCARRRNLLKLPHYRAPPSSSPPPEEHPHSGDTPLISACHRRPCGRDPKDRTPPPKLSALQATIALSLLVVPASPWWVHGVLLSPLVVRAPPLVAEAAGAPAVRAPLSRRGHLCRSHFGLPRRVSSPWTGAVPHPEAAGALAPAGGGRRQRGQRRPRLRLASPLFCRENGRKKKKPGQAGPSSLATPLVPPTREGYAWALP
ncbi:uncharacterized protein LOC119292729 [Triticum dicoccoides]|uniref:uncharacterized protein LOC119292729 n=1 Tax=Triticum dicoccoides TaxID=85692 RepID=UPI00188E695B|nr:uncharacterized protein LOC119292729 [Triticum dicoccoides]